MTRTFAKLLILKVLALTAGVHASLREAPPTAKNQTRIQDTFLEYSRWTAAEAAAELQALVAVGSANPQDVDAARKFVLENGIFGTTTLQQIYQIRSALIVNADPVGRQLNFVPRLVRLQIIALGRVIADCTTNSLGENHRVADSQSAACTGR